MRLVAPALLLVALSAVAQVQPTTPNQPCKLTKAQKLQNWQEKMQHKPITDFCAAKPAPPTTVSTSEAATPPPVMTGLQKTEIVQGTLTLGDSPSYTDPSGKVTPLTAFKNGQPGAYDNKGNFYVKQTINGQEMIVKGTVPTADRPAANQSVNTQLDKKRERTEDPSVVAKAKQTVAADAPDPNYNIVTYDGVPVKRATKDYRGVASYDVLDFPAGGINGLRIGGEMIADTPKGKAHVYDFVSPDGNKDLQIQVRVIGNQTQIVTPKS